MKKLLKVAAITVFLAYTARADYDVTFSHGGSYFTVESGDIDPGLAFGHGFLAPGSGAGARFDFWIATDGAIDGTGTNGGGGASTLVTNLGVAGGNDTYLASTTLIEDGVDQYNGGAGLDTERAISARKARTRHLGRSHPRQSPCSR